MRFEGISMFVLTTLLASATATFSFQNKHMTKNTRKAQLVSKLVERAKETENSQLHRGLEQAEVDLSGYEIKFQQCQFVKAYDDELAEDEESKTVLGTQRFIVFRLCPADSCESCAYNYGEYVIDLESYLESALEYFVQDREGTCQMCEEVCYADDDATKNRGAAYVDCDECAEYCAYFENMDENGKYMESYEMAECQQVYADDNGNAIFAGAMCSNNGAAIKIGAFSDEDCSQVKKNTDIEDYLENGLQFDNDILEKIVDVDSCVSCTAKDYEVPDDDGNQNQNDEVEVNQMCENLYEMAAKCESKYGFDNYWKYYEEYENQYVQEDLVCDFISSLGNGNYDEYGEIVLSGSVSGNVIAGATGGQKFALTIFILSTTGLAVFAASLHSQLTKGAKADLSSQGGAMA